MTYYELEFDQLITTDGAKYYFNNGIDKFIWGDTGRGMPPMTMRTERGPFQHGDTILGFVLRPRVIQMVHRINGCSRNEYWANRESLLNLIRPNRHGAVFDVPVLRKVMPDGTKRDIKVLISSGPSFRPSTPGLWDEYSIEEGLRFIAHDPIFFDPDENVVSLPLDFGDDSLVFAIEFSIEFGIAETAVQSEITYTGSWLSYPTIVLNGPLNQPRIRNITTGESIKLDYNVPAGRTVTISLEYGKKTVSDDLGTNLIGTLTPDSSLATFHLAPSPEAPGGVNEFGGDASGKVVGQSEIIIRYFTRYIGI